jgi:hypothetical protein
MEQIKYAATEVEIIARKISENLFKDGFGRKATRLVMEYDNKKIDGTGWCEDAVKDIIQKHLLLKEEIK